MNRRGLKRRIGTSLLQFALLGGATVAGVGTGTFSAASSGIVSVSPAVHQDVSPALGSLPAAQSTGVPRLKKDHTRGLPLIGAGTVSSASPTTAAAAPAVASSFDGVGLGLVTYSPIYAPPDPNGAVGPNHFVETVNVDFAIFGKTGSLLYGPAAINTVWSGFGGGCQIDNDGDPIVLYDRINDRWIIDQIAYTTTHYLNCIAVSTSGDPLGTYNR